MIETLLFFAAGLLGLVGVLFVAGLMLSPRWRVERSVRIRATPERIYPLIANFEDGWSRWNPFGPRKHPGIEMTFSGPAEGLGASQSWTGKGAPAGRMSITHAVPEQSVHYVMNTAGFEVKGTITCRPDGEYTIVTWSDEGSIGNPLLRLMTLLVERTVGKPFEEGLSTLKREIESVPSAPRQ
jgi:hypothetical protein